MKLLFIYIKRIDNLFYFFKYKAVSLIYMINNFFDLFVDYIFSNYKNKKTYFVLNKYIIILNKQIKEDNNII